MAAILNSALLYLDILSSWIQTTCYLLLDSLKNTLTPLWLWLKLIQSDSNAFILTLTWWWQPSWILPSWIHPFWQKSWLKLIQYDSNSFILTQLDDGSHLELLSHLDSAYHLHKKNFTHSFWLNSMIAAIMNSVMLGFRPQPSWIQTPCYLLSDSLKNTLTPLWLWLKLIQSDSNSFILT